MFLKFLLEMFLKEKPLKLQLMKVRLFLSTIAPQVRLPLLRIRMKSMFPEM